MTHPIYVITLDPKRGLNHIHLDDSPNGNMLELALRDERELFRGSLKECLDWARENLSDDVADDFIRLMAADKALSEGTKQPR
jgi:hypothetical protein